MSNEGRKHKAIKNKSFKIKDMKSKLKIIFRFLGLVIFICVFYNIGFYLSKRFFIDNLDIFSQIMFGLGMLMICVLSPFIVKNYEKKEENDEK